MQTAFSSTGLVMATGNKFSRTADPDVGDFFGVFVDVAPHEVDYYCFDDLLSSDVEIPYKYRGIKNIFRVQENGCPTEYCISPCITPIDLPLRKAEFASHKSLLQTAISNSDTIGATYHRNEMDDLAGEIAQYYIMDTLAFSSDSVSAWYGNMDAITGQLLQSGQLADEGNFLQAISIINGIPFNYPATQLQVDGLNDLSTVYGILSIAKADSLSAAQQASMLSIADDDSSLASSYAKAVLMLNGYHFDPIYYTEVRQARAILPDIQGPISSEKEHRFNVYPNPMSEELYVRIDDEIVTEALFQFELIDMQGRVVISETVSNGKLNVSLAHVSLVSGIYTYRIMSDHQVIDTGRIVVK